MMGTYETDAGNKENSPVNVSGPETEVGRRERTALLADCLAAVQRVDPLISFVLLMAFFKEKENEEIARELDVTIRTVLRYKEKGLKMLREQLASRGIDKYWELEWSV